ncbi:Imm21 family immunity protein [Streptomyces sp. NPDC051214]|uniref:Imm21 family immunity protein n=1 Tax=Streptomyces sp. NPDC051214 TaxID=3155282 RepID=UPI00343B1A45
MTISQDAQAPGRRSTELHWVESMGGPLIVVPVSALSLWHGCTEAGEVLGDPGIADDYDRACAVDGYAEVLPVGGDGASALVLGDEPAMTCYLPERNAFVRWFGADSEAGLLSAARQVMEDPGTEWEDCGVWETSGPAVLMDSAVAGEELTTPSPELPEQAPVDIPAGRWEVQAAYVRTDDARVGLVRLMPLQ